jgi:2-methylisocitrate lyase-like PEP mutase family enzyme
VTQADRATAFRALHARDHAFIIPNPWDAGTARLLAHLGFPALATTSAGYAFSLGRRDTNVNRDEMLAHVAAIAAATALPVSADLENGYGDSPETVAETVRRAAIAGAVGCSIEDATNRPDQPIYELAAAVERIRAAVAAAAALPFAFTLTARAENYLHGRLDLADTVARLRAFEEAGAHVVYAPGVRTRDELAAVVRAVRCPVNALIGSHSKSLAELSALGVKRVSVGSGLARAALGAFLRGARELRDHGTFTFVDDAVSFAEVTAMFEP